MLAEQRRTELRAQAAVPSAEPPRAPAGSRAPDDTADPTAEDPVSHMLRAELGGDLGAVPMLRVPIEHVPALQLTQLEAFVLATVDGELRYEDILDVCCLPRRETLAILVRLAALRIIGPE